YDIKYEALDGTFKYCHQTTFGMSERLLGAVVGVHGDDKGLVLPPDIAPFQAVIIPILAKGKVDEVAAEARKLKEELVKAGVRVTLDDSDERPGSKFFKWEIKGVPLRLELGMRDIEAGKVSFAVRLDGRKGTFERKEVAEQVKATLQTIREQMDDGAREKMLARIQTIESADSIPSKVVRFGWCGELECGHAFEQRTELKLLGTPYTSEEFVGKCIICGKETNTSAYAARSM
ncbi:MAG: proline--tRNA ligase, partial [Euryarchaeota archaeon]|nr:proline--tRNA ligase [Euryarchaeota archaeon]